MSMHILLVVYIEIIVYKYSAIHIAKNFGHQTIIEASTTNIFSFEARSIKKT